MKLPVIFAISFFIVSLILNIGEGFYYYNNLSNILEKHTYEHLESVVQAKAKHVIAFLNEQKIFAENLSFIEGIEILLLTDRNDSEYNDKVEAVNKRLQKITDSIESILGISVLDKNGTMVVSRDSAFIGADFSGTEFFQKDEKISMIEIVYVSSKGYVIGVGAPVNGLETGEFLGMIGFELNKEKLDEIVIDRIGLGEMGEIYVVDKGLNLVTPSRFIENSIMVQEVDTENTRDCFKHYERFYNPETKEMKEHENEMKVFLDYRGIEVLGVHSYVPEMQWCVLVEMDKSEALGIPMNNLLKTFLIFMTATSVIVSLIGFFVGKWIDRRFLLTNEKDRS